MADESVTDPPWEGDKEKTYARGRRECRRTSRESDREKTYELQDGTIIVQGGRDGGEDLRAPRRQHHRSESTVCEGLVSR